MAIANLHNVVYWHFGKENQESNSEEAREPVPTSQKKVEKADHSLGAQLSEERALKYTQLTGK